MNFQVRDGKFDVAVVAAPRVEVWPSVGVRALSTLCAEMGLTVGLFGGSSITVRGVIPLPGTGGLLIVEDSQHRIHRIHARAIVRITPECFLPDPFTGWQSPGLIPISTAEKLFRDSRILWTPTTVILGSGNRALGFGSQLLRSALRSEGTEVYCVETYAAWGAKRFAGWEVEKRRFEMSGGKLIEAKPLQISAKGPLLWQLRLQDTQGVRLLEVGRVVSAGPFRPQSSVREYPPGSFLFEMEQSSASTHAENVEGWVLEEERGKWLAGKIVKSLVAELGPKRAELDQIYRRARGRLRKYSQHREAPYTPAYQGKWLSPNESRQMRSFSGIPQEAHHKRPVASVECFEEIPCDVCQKVCPTSAIQIGKIPRVKSPILSEKDCTACGLCVAACPTSSIPLIEESESRSMSKLTLPWFGKQEWVVGEFSSLLNRRGESLGSARVVGVSKVETPESTQLVQLEVPTHLIWEARGIRRNRPQTEADHLSGPVMEDDQRFIAERVEILLNGEKRLVRDRIPISIALFEIGQPRPADVLLCPDGGCNLCQISVDGVKKLACQTPIHPHMSIRIKEGATVGGETHGSGDPSSALCPCLAVSKETVEERLKQGKLQSPEAVISVTHVGEGKCHGQLCMPAFKRLMQEQGIDVERWIDWRFPWSDWVLTPGSGLGRPRV